VAICHIHTVPSLTVDDLATLRDVVAFHTSAVNLHLDQAAELVLAVHEVAVNSIRHGGGQALLRAWTEQGTVVCEVSDSGWAPDPLAGRERPPAGARQGRGLWLLNEWCDLVQWRSSFAGTLVRLHMSTRSPHPGTVPSPERGSVLR
jgi:anti-sigma regulatory factor (Ser/Thr protein kinase)